MEGPTDPRKPPTDPRIAFPTDPRIASVDPRIAPVDPRIALVDPRIAPVDPRIAPMDPRIAPIDPRIAPVDPRIAPVDPRVAPVDPRIAPIDPRIAPIDPRIAPIDPRIAPIDPKIPAENPKAPEKPKPEIPSDPRKPAAEKPKAPEPAKASESSEKPAPKAAGKPLRSPAKKPVKVLTKAEIAERIEKNKKTLNKLVDGLDEKPDETTKKVETVVKQKTPQIKIVPLGAGQDVGRSCILITIGGKNIMVDCGMHMGYQDDRRFPDFSYIGGGGRLTDYLDCVIISHFHLDHCGSLPHMSEIVGYDGPIYMTYPTKAICPVLLEDYRKVQCDIKGETNFFTSDNIKNCMKKVIGCALHEIIQVDDQLSIRAFYAGHVLGAAMFEIRVGDQSVLYTGDYNMTPDRHLGAARVLPGVRPTLLISESTYATTIRDSKRARERDFLRKVHEAVMKGGKVIIPVFALGRAQELCILLESYWERMALSVPIYFSQGLAERANQYYRLFISWTNENIKNTFVDRNMFEFKHIRPMEKGCEDQPGPQVLFSTPGMLHGGQSLKVFKKWCGDPINMIIMPGYCVAGTVGARVINGEKRIEIDGKWHDIRLGVEYMSFSAHADAKGIMHLIRQCEPKHVMFVHGEADKMEFLKGKVEKEYKVPVHMPANGETVVIDTEPTLDVQVPMERIDRSIDLDPNPSKRECPFLADFVFDQETETINIMPTAESERLIETDECMPISLSFSEILRIGKIDWEKLAAHLLLFDPNLQHKDDGIEMFHGEITFLSNNEEETELEATWDECRDHWFSVLRNSIFENFSPGSSPPRSQSRSPMNM